MDEKIITLRRKLEYKKGQRDQLQQTISSLQDRIKADKRLYFVTNGH
jgi:hypothetical protein